MDDTQAVDGHVPYTTVSSSVVWEGRLTTMREDAVAMPDGSVATREIAEHLDAVAVVPVFEDGTVVLVHQYRHPVGRKVLEIPAGLLDVDGEDPQVGAARELAEEVQLEAAAWTRLTRFANSAGWTDEHTTIWLATDLRATTPPDDFVVEGEEADMETVRLPLTAAVEAVAAGEITDAKTALGLLLAARHLAI